jgi:hypothetical protein
VSSTFRIARTRTVFLPMALSLLAVPLLWSFAGDVNEFPLAGLEAGRLYAVTASVEAPYRLATSEIEVSVSDPRGPVASKLLHAGDLDLYVTLRPRASGAGMVRRNRRAGAKGIAVAVECRPMDLLPASEKRPVAIAAVPSGSWAEAQEFELGQTVFGSADVRPFVPAPSEDVYRALVKGFEWLKFTYRGTAPKLAYFTLDVLDREVPVDLEIFELGKDAAGREDVVPSKGGQFAYVPEATQNFPGMYKFRTRVLEPGRTYYVRIAANHPAYQLRTSLYDPPPYRDPQLAVRAGADFLLNLGDSWHANTPRRGSTALRSAMPHSETQLCIACHPTQFTTRGALIAASNGYPVTQRPSLKFLIERLYNNPRPLYGEEDTNWVRVIYSARTVASRIPWLLDLYEKQVSREAPRPGVNLGYGNYLRIHYNELKELPGEEADGCSPSVSPFEIAAQSYKTLDLLERQTGDSDWKMERDRVERLALPGVPRNVIDLAWKITLLAYADRSRHRAELEKLVAQLYGLQRDSGMWPYRFDASSRESDFITYHALYALAVAGERPERSPNLRKTVELCLSRQRRDGSWQGDPGYKGFDTPFRDTQFAVMALSELFHGPGGTGWQAGFPPPPSVLHPEKLDLFLAEADQFWELPGEETLAVLRRVAVESDQPLARQAALAALGRVADPKGLEAALAGLGARTKLVQITAGWAVREIAVRRGVGRAEIARALSSHDDRVRWGAARVFNQHFRDLTRDIPLMEALVRNLDDPLPHVRYQAAAGLWRWYCWQADSESRRGRILDALAARMGREEHPLARRGLIESIYDLLDENTGYLRAWVKASASPEDRRMIEAGYEAVVRQQNQLLGRALRQGNALAREGILTALWDFHTRHMALPEKTTFQINLPPVYNQYVAGVPDLHRAGYDYPPYRDAASFRYDVANGFQQTRIGNDSELIHFYRSSGSALEEALIDCLEGADGSMKVNVLKAGHTLSEAGGPRFALAVLRLSQDADPKVREAVRYVYERGGRGILNLANADGAVDRSVADAVAAVLKAGNDEGLAVVLPLLAELDPDSPWTREAAVAAALRPLVESRAGKTLYADVLRAAGSFPELLASAALQRRVESSLRDASPEVRRAAMQLLLARYVPDPKVAQFTGRVLAGLDSPLRGLLISELSAPRRPTYRGRAASATGLDVAFLRADDVKPAPDPLLLEPVRDAVASSLSDRDANVRAAALDLVARRKDVRAGPKVTAALTVLGNDPAPRVARLARTLIEGRDIETAFAEDESARLLDFDFFVRRVQPILAKRGPDGMACVLCHESHVVLKLQPPDYNEQFSDKRSRENYRYAAGVVNLAEPEKSLILIKPTRPTDSAGDVSDYLATHNGGQRWAGNEKSEEYRTLLEWIRGARLAN